MATEAKEKGNAAFKSGDFYSAIGHYTTAILANRVDPTLPLNRAAAYLKLSKHLDAERDCTTAIQLNAKNVKAYFRRAQARMAANKIAEAEQDLQAALRLEPSNEAVKQELKKIQDSTKMQAKNAKGTTIAATHPSTSSGSTKPSSSKPSTIRKRIPIEIVEPSGPSSSKPGEIPAPQNKPKTDEPLRELSSRRLTNVPSSTIKPAPVPTPVPVPAPSQSSSKFRETQEVKGKRVGGGIFRPPKAQEEPLAPKDSDSNVASLPLSDLVEDKPTESQARDTTPRSTSFSTPSTLFDFSQAWNNLSGWEDRWSLFSTLSPDSLPQFFKDSLDSTLLMSIIELFQHNLKAGVALTDSIRGTMREYMLVFPQVSRFRTVALFLSNKEKDVFRDVLRDLGFSADSKLWGL